MAGARGAAAARTLLVVGSVLTVVALVQFLREAAAPTALGDDTVHEKWLHGDDVHGTCALGDFIRLMPCKSNVNGKACCGALKGIFEHKCACRPIPGIVMGHGGNSISFIQDYIRCNFTAGGQTPIDYVVNEHPCIDQNAWCNDKIHNLDVRLDAYETGHLQVWDQTAGWVFASPDGTDMSHLEHLGNTVCKGLNFEGVRIKNGHHGDPDYPAVYLDTHTRPSKLVKCNPAAAHLGSLSACTVSDCEGDACNAGAVTINCAKGGAPQICGRATMSKVTHNHLHCRGGDDAGYEKEDHERRVGAPHMVCGTAGINESRIEWFDGFQDDFDTYEVKRNPVGKLTGYEKWTGPVHGTDLLTHDEYKQTKEVQKQLKEAIKAAKMYAAEEHVKLKDAMEKDGKTFDTVFKEHMYAFYHNVHAWGKRSMRLR